LDETAAESGGADDKTTSESERRRKKNGVLPVLALPDRIAPAILERISRRGRAKAGSEFTQTRASSVTIGRCRKHCRRRNRGHANESHLILHAPKGAR